LSTAAFKRGSKMKKYAAISIHCNGTTRISPFFDTIEECRKAYPSADSIVPYANWAEHEQWSKEKVGTYKYYQIETN
jgi:hypothetical protein